MNNRALLKYQIGLAVIGVFTLVALVIVVGQANGIKHDNETYKKANKVATKLDSYVNGSGTVPSSLAAAGIRDVPGEVSYRKLSSERYEFCVTYKTKSNGFDATYLETQLVTGGQASKFYSSGSEGETSYLYLSNYHKKGKNCQTVKTYNYSDYYNYPSSTDNSTDNYNYDNTQSF